MKEQRILATLKVSLLILLLLGLPSLGVLLKGDPLGPYLEFPPTTKYVEPLQFSWLVFGILAALISAVIAPFFLRVLQFSVPHNRVTSQVQPFPWWGWVGLGIAIIAWYLAWTRFSWFQALQIHTFTPLWIGYILTINGLTLRRTGHCLMKDRPRLFLALFVLSAGFWWLFEYLNRFAKNWFYMGAGEWDAVTYVWAATMPFSTVLPAVLGTCEYLHSYPRLSLPFQSWWKISIAHKSCTGWAMLFFASLGLLGIGSLPTLFYPLVWMSPLFILLGFQHIFGERNVLEYLEVGDWRPVVIPALASLICGFFWEMWNYHSLAHWEYAIPYVHGFQLFEMPLLGYSGYFPFGITCVAFVQFLLRETRYSEFIYPLSLRL